MRHIYLINSDSRAAQYGIGTYIIQVINCLSSIDSLRLTVVSMNSEDGILTEKKDNNVRYLTFSKVYDWRSEKEIQRYYRSVAFLLALYVDSSEDNVFHFNYLHHEPLVDLLKKIYPTSQFVLTLHYLNWCFTLKGNIKRLQTVLDKAENDRTEEEKYIYDEYKQEVSLYRKVDRIICLAQYTKMLLNEFYGIEECKLTLIYNGLIDQAIFLDEVERMQRKRDLFFGEGEKLILFVGRLDDIKGVDYLIEAFAKVIKKSSNTRLLIVGDGNYSRYLQMSADIWSRITFIGKISKQKLYEFYQIADVGVMPSFHEQCSYAAIEMMMHGLPLIITNTTGLSEMIHHQNVECRLILREDQNELRLSVEELSKCLLKIVTDDCWAREVGKLNRCRYKDAFSLEKMRMAFESFYS